jgi:hypothetical protein
MPSDRLSLHFASDLLWLRSQVAGTAHSDRSYPL